MNNENQTSNEIKRICVGVQLTESLHNQLKAIAREKSLTASAIVRLALLKYFESEGK
ncbi:MAG: hypothetical protein IKA31_01995 [Clostridia bacterium]|nr:hypothetical protein [Clostridia bacterium]